MKMKDKSKTKKELIDELILLRKQISTLEGSGTGSKTIQRRIGDSPQFNLKILAASPVGILTFNSSGECIYANEAASKIVGVTIEQLLTQNFRYLESWKTSGMLEAAENALMKGQDQVLETHLVTTFGKDRWFSCRFAPFGHEGVVHLLLLVSDITERKHMEETLIESEGRLMQAQAIANLGSWEIDLTKQTMWASEEAFRIYGMEYTGSASASMPLAEAQKLVHPQDRPRMDSALLALLNENKKYDQEFRIFRVNDGELRVIHSRADLLFSEKKLPLKVFGTIQDITERKHADEGLREAYRRLDEIIEFLPDATCVIDADGKVIAWNRAVEQMTGIPKAEMIGKGEYEYALPFYGERRRVLIDLALLPDAEFEKRRYDIDHRGTDTIYGNVYVPTMYGGKGAYLHGAASSLRDAAGNIVGAIESIRDFTERKRTEEA
ncbi:MAG: PAS domain S-box protein, partial [Syntrophales bacterium]